MLTPHQHRFALGALLVMLTGQASAQGTENAIGAAVLFGALVIGVVLAGLVITLMYLFKRRRWQRFVVLVFGASLLVVGLWVGTQPGRPSDMEFLQLFLSSAGIVFLLLGSLLRTKRVA